MNCLFDILEAFEIDEPVNVVFLRKTFRDFRLVFGDTPNEIVGHAYVESAADSACQYVDIKGSCAHYANLSVLGRPVKPGDDISSRGRHGRDRQRGDRLDLLHRETRGDVLQA